MRRVPKQHGKVARETWCVVVEGEKREFNYFSQAAVEFNAREQCRGRGVQKSGLVASPPIRTLTVLPARGGSVPQIIDRARRELENYDKVHVVLDGDTLDGPGLSAVRECVLAGVHACLSYPCFEVWLLLHFEDTCAVEVACQPLKNKLARLWPEFERRPQRDWERLKPNMPRAKSAANRLRTQRPDKLGTTEVDRLMNALGF